MEVVGGQEFLLLPVEEMERLLMSDDVNVPEEETMVTSLLTWVSHDADTRESHLPLLLAHIRLPLLQPQVSSALHKTHQRIRFPRTVIQKATLKLKPHKYCMSAVVRVLQLYFFTIGYAAFFSFAFRKYLHMTYLDKYLCFARISSREVCCGCLGAELSD